MKITSTNNDIVKETAKLLQKKYRKETNLFLIEGEKGIKEAVEFGIEIVRVFIHEDFLNSLSSVEKDKIIETTDAVLAKISESKSAPKLVAVAKQPQNKSINEVNNYKKILLLEDIKDAGNLGTIIRTAVAFEIDCIILYKNTIDLYNPKVVRATVGNLWKIPIFETDDFNTLEEQFADFERIATLPENNNSVFLNKYKVKEKTLIMFGSEANGLSENLKQFATKNITIKMSEKVESLNLSVSVSIILNHIYNN